ncbi:uncharacterized protein LOC130754905 isoform X2 [Actinidia eriantha]|uniref:uncharacterized protein LOC130754905 isoform X2 n=1 Tax=Actinidia eriantha TaxID=165200 RepID=UPI002590DD6B|nr:uncharacterized protein LOC130754905 isoform X2 [Actinidia eriantha]
MELLLELSLGLGHCHLIGKGHGRIDQVMGDNLDNGANPHAFTSLLQDNVEFTLTNGQNDATESTGIFRDGSIARADPMSFPYMPSQMAPFPWKNMQGTYQPYGHNIPETCGNLMIDLNKLHNLQKKTIDPNSVNIASNIPCMYGQDLQHQEWNLQRVSCNVDKTLTGDNVTNYPAHFNSFQNPEINRNFPLIRDYTRGGYEMTRQGGETYNSNIYRPQIKTFVGLGGRTTYDIQNIEGIGIGNNDEACAAQLGCPNILDGSFLSLGIGCNTDAEPKSHHSSREITCERDGDVSSQLYTSRVRPATGSSLNLGHNFVGGFSSFQNNVGGFTSPRNYAGGLNSSNNHIGVTSGINSGLNSRQIHILQKPQADMRHHFPTSSSRNLGILGGRDAKYANLDPYKGIMGELAASSRPCSTSSSGLHDSRQTGASGLASESVKLSWTTSQPTSDQLQRRLMETVQNFMPANSMVSSFRRFKGSSAKQEHSGQLFSANDGNMPHVAAGDLFPKRGGVQVSKVGTPQAARSGLLPQRLGFQLNKHRAAQAARHGLLPKSTGIQVTNSHVAYATECGTHPEEIDVQMASCSQEGLHMQFSKDLTRPTSTAGQAISTAKGWGFSVASDVLGGPSLKRSAIRPPSAAPRVQRRKITPQPYIHPSVPFPYAVPAALIPIPDPVNHIKWKDFDGLPQPIGRKCFLCKRDLSFTPEGPVHQPTMPPAVAVLPCGHTFHDHCLQLITPEDQSKNPPCIPCAIGDI